VHNKGKVREKTQVGKILSLRPHGLEIAVTANRQTNSTKLQLE